VSDAQLYQRFGKEFAAGTVLFREGEPGSEMYVVQSGKVRISIKVRNVEKVLVDLDQGEFFGEMSLLNGAPRSATATVVDPAQLLVIDPRTFEAMVRGSGDIAVRMIKKLAARLQEADDQIGNLLLKDATSRVVHLFATLCRGAEPTEQGVPVEAPLDKLSAKTGLEPDQVEGIVERLKQSELIHAEGERLFVTDIGKLEEFLAFLEMKEKFDNT
jgi:CRP/FNR family cyclic AMP-dependent transcriptional regulator